MREFCVVCASGWFDPLHVGHIEYLKNARLLGDKLVVILNSDAQRRGTTRLPASEADRRAIIQSLRYVDEVFVAVDTDTSVCQSLRQLQPTIFAKGLVPNPSEIRVCEDLGIKVVCNVGQNIHLHDALKDFVG